MHFSSFYFWNTFRKQARSWSAKMLKLSGQISAGSNIWQKSEQRQFWVENKNTKTQLVSTVRPGPTKIKVKRAQKLQEEQFKISLYGWALKLPGIQMFQRIIASQKICYFPMFGIKKDLSRSKQVAKAKHLNLCRTY